MKLTLDIPESDLAHAWADATWNGNHPEPLEKILTGIIATAASKHRSFLRDLAGDTHQDYQTMHQQTLAQFQSTLPA